MSEVVDNDVPNLLIGRVQIGIQKQVLLKRSLRFAQKDANLDFARKSRTLLSLVTLNLGLPLSEAVVEVVHLELSIQNGIHPSCRSGPLGRRKSRTQFSPSLEAIVGIFLPANQL